MNMPNKNRILYIEDDVALARLVERILQRGGYEVDLAPDGQAGLKACAAEEYDLLVIGHCLPGMSGLEIVRTLSALTRSPATIIVTANGSEEIAVEAMKAGASDYLVKDTAGCFLEVLPIAAARAIDNARLSERIRRAEEMQRKSESRYRSLFEGSPDAIMVFADEGFIDCNPAALRLFACKHRRDFIGKYPAEFSPFEQPDGVNSWIAASRHVTNALRDGTACFAWVHRRLDGTEFPAEVQLSVVEFNGQQAFQAMVHDITKLTLPCDNDRPVQMTCIPIWSEDARWQYLGVCVDIRERKRMEMELAKAQKLESIGQLAAGIAHEINTPSQFVGDNVRFLKDAFSDIDAILAALAPLGDAADSQELPGKLLEELRDAARKLDFEHLRVDIPEAIRETLAGINHISSIVKAMKEFAHPGGEHVQQVDLNQIVCNAITICRNEWKHVATVVTDLADDLPPVECLPREIGQAILNIMINAAHAMAEATERHSGELGVIRVSTRQPDSDLVEIRVQDSGTGIAEQHQSRIFEPFFTTKDVGKGTGQGLAITHGIVVDKHGGSISVESTRGLGATFTITLPLRPENDHLPEDDETSSQDSIAAAADQSGNVNRDAPIASSQQS